MKIVGATGLSGLWAFSMKIVGATGFVGVRVGVAIDRY